MLPPTPRRPPFLLLLLLLLLLALAACDGDALPGHADAGAAAADAGLADAGTVSVGPLDLVVDLNPRGQGISPYGFVVADGVAYFVGSTPETGWELYRSDGTASGTALVKDLRAGPDSSLYSLADAAALGGALYFAASDGDGGSELWRSDGTAAGTTRMVDLAPGVAASSIGMLTRVGDALYFSARIAGGAATLYRTDGSAAGTAAVAPGGALAGVALGDTLLYWSDADPATGWELWRSDGTAEGTGPVVELRPGAASPGQSPLVVVAGLAYFIADDGQSGAELWRSDGTAGGTVQVLDLWPGPQSGLEIYSQPLVALGDELYFFADDGTTGQEPWRSDGSAGGTVRLGDLAPGATGSSPRGFTRHDGAVYFAASTAVAGRELWRSDGTPASAAMVVDLVPGVGGSNATPVGSAGATLFVMASTPETGMEPWRLVGDDDLALVADVYPGPVGGLNSNAVALTDGLLFGASDAEVDSTLYHSDGSAVGTAAVFDRLPGVTGSSQPSWDLSAALDDALIFVATDGASGYELFRSDGTAAGSGLLLDVAPGLASGLEASSLAVRPIVTASGTCFFVAAAPGHGGELWAYDAVAGVRQVIEIGPDAATGVGATGIPIQPIAVGDRAYFAAQAGGSGLEPHLWRSDGSAVGTSPVVELTLAWPRPLVRFGAAVVVSAYVADGAAVYRVTDPPGGRAEAIRLSPYGRTARYAVETGDVVYFLADAPGATLELWRSDGTFEGTTLVRGFVAGSYAGGMLDAGGQLLFAARDGAAGPYALWFSDGTVEGTARLTPDGVDLANNPDEPLATLLGGQVYFRATDDVHGVELWVTDLTPSGTTLVADLNPGGGHGLWSSTFAHAGRLYFAGRDAEHGTELWRTDGAGGLELVVDMVPGPGSAGCRPLREVAGVLYLSCGGPLGAELWRLADQ